MMLMAWLMAERAGCCVDYSASSSAWTVVSRCAVTGGLGLGLGARVCRLLAERVDSGFFRFHFSAKFTE